MSSFSSAVQELLRTVCTDVAHLATVVAILVLMSIDVHRLPFVLLADPKTTLRRAFGVPKTLGLMQGRVTYVADREGVIRHIFDSQLLVNQHVTEALATVQTLTAN